MVNATRLIRPRDRADVDPRVTRSKDVALQAALEILLEEGWDAVTHVRVAERSGVGRTTLYRHWAERSALLRDALLLYGVGADHHLTGNLREDLVTVVDDSRLQMGTEEMHRLLATLFERAACAPTPDFRLLLHDLLRRHTDVLRTLLGEAIRSGAIRPDLDVEEAIVTLLAPLTYRLMASGAPNTRALVERAVDNFLEFNR